MLTVEAVSNYPSCKVAWHRPDGSVTDVHANFNTARRLLSSALVGNYMPVAGSNDNPSAICDRYCERRLLLCNYTSGHVWQLQHGRHYL